MECDVPSCRPQAGHRHSNANGSTRLPWSTHNLSNPRSSRCMRRKAEPIQRHFVVDELVVHVCAAVFAVDASVPASGSSLNDFDFCLIIYVEQSIAQITWCLPSCVRTMEEEMLGSVVTGI